MCKLCGAYGTPFTYHNLCEDCIIKLSYAEICADCFTKIDEEYRCLCWKKIPVEDLRKYVNNISVKKMDEIMLKVVEEKLGRPISPIERKVIAIFSEEVKSLSFPRTIEALRSL